MIYPRSLIYLPELRDARGTQQTFNKHSHVNKLLKIDLGFLADKCLIGIPIATMIFFLSLKFCALLPRSLPYCS